MRDRAERCPSVAWGRAVAGKVMPLPPSSLASHGRHPVLLPCRVPSEHLCRQLRNLIKGQENSPGRRMRQERPGEDSPLITARGVATREGYAL